MANNPNAPAFPCEEVHGDGTQILTRHQGMSLRQYAAIEMAKAIVSASGVNGSVDYDEAAVSKSAVRLADTVLAELAP